MAVVKSAAEGSEEALAQLQKGAGAGSYKSAIKHEVDSSELVKLKSRRAKCGPHGPHVFGLDLDRPIRILHPQPGARASSDQG